MYKYMQKSLQIGVIFHQISNCMKNKHKKNKQKLKKVSILLFYSNKVRKKETIKVN